MPVTTRESSGNDLLQRLPRSERRRFIAGCDVVELVRGQELFQSMQRLDQVYFPTTGYVSLIITVDESSHLEVGLIGTEGVVGAALALGVAESNVRAVVQGAGSALCMDAASFASEIVRNKPLAALVGRYVCAQLSQLERLAACSRYHVIEARLARWLLMTQDRTHADVFYLTHELLAAMLGVRRVGITKAASALQRRKLIQYSRGTVTVLNRRALKSIACSCYRADIQSYAAVFS